MRGGEPTGLPCAVCHAAALWLHVNVAGFRPFARNGSILFPGPAEGRDVASSLDQRLWAVRSVLHDRDVCRDERYWAAFAEESDADAAAVARACRTAMAEAADGLEGALSSGPEGAPWAACECAVPRPAHAAFAVDGLGPSPHAVHLPAGGEGRPGGEVLRVLTCTTDPVGASASMAFLAATSPGPLTVLCAFLRRDRVQQTRAVEFARYLRSLGSEELRGTFVLADGYDVVFDPQAWGRPEMAVRRLQAALERSGLGAGEGVLMQANGLYYSMI